MLDQELRNPSCSPVSVFHTCIITGQVILTSLVVSSSIKGNLSQRHCGSQIVDPYHSQILYLQMYPFN